MYRQFNIQQFYVLPTQCIYVCCVDLRTNSDYFPIQYQMIGLYNRDGECLLRGTDWIFISSSCQTSQHCRRRLSRDVVTLSRVEPPTAVATGHPPWWCCKTEWSLLVCVDTVSCVALWLSEGTAIIRKFPFVM